MVDIHTHVLPGIDDGPRDLAGSIAMAQLAAQGGTGILIATPHLRADHPDVVVEELAARVAELNERLAQQGAPIEVRPGAEVSLEAAESLPDERLRLATLGANGRDLLIETPYDHLPHDFEDRLSAILARGFRITLAHPERNPTLQLRVSRLGELVDRVGVLTQVTARSVRRDRASGALAVHAIRHRWAHVLATDAHAPYWRPPDLAAGVRRASEVLPRVREELTWMATEAPRAIVEGRELPPRPERPAAWRQLVRRAR
jgi:protein-tyrosine phosphatase